MTRGARLIGVVDGRTARARTSLACAALIIVVVGCPLEGAVFGAPCATAADCPSPYRCFDASCVPDDFPDELVAVGDGETCADAVPLALGGVIEGSTADAVDDVQAICAGDSTSDEFYVVEIPASTAVRITLEPAGWDGALHALSGCGPLDVVADSCTDDPVDAFAVETLLLPNVPAGQLIIVVDGARPAVVPTAGPYRLSVEAVRDCPVGSQDLAGACVGVIKTTSMGTSRTNTTATLLADGRVLVAGGRSGANVATTNTAEVFDPATDTFSPVGAMQADRARHAAVLLADGRVLVVGGVTGSDGSYTAIDDAELFDPLTGAFSATLPVPSPRDLFTATLLGDGTVLVAGGRNGATTHADAFLFDPATPAWTTIPGGLGAARFGHTATLLADGDVLLVGGRVGADSITVNAAERYRDGAGFLPTVAEPVEARGGHSALRLADGRVIVAGGFARPVADTTIALAGTETYDAASDEWATVGQLNQPRLFSVLAPFAGGALLLGGDIDSPVATVELFQPSSDLWIRMPALETPRLALSGVALDDGRVLVLGGDGNPVVEEPLASAELYGVLP